MIRKLLYILYIAFLSPAFLLAQINTDRVLTIGKNALYFEDYVLSIQYFNQVINAKPYLAEPYFYRGLAKINLDDFRGAESDCSEAIQRNPFVVNAYQIRGISRIRQDKFKGAIADYQKALTLDSENISLWHNLILCRIQEKDYGVARAELDTLIRIAPRYTDAYLMGSDVAMRQKDTVQALTFADKAIDMDRYSPGPWSARAMIFLQREKFKEAEMDLDEAVHLSYRDANVYINRALARYHQNNLRGAMADYDVALDIDPNHFIGRYNRGLFRAQVGDDNNAIEDFNFVLKVEPDNMMALFNRGLLLDRTGDYKGAISDYSAVLKEYPSFLPGYQYRAAARKKIGDFKGANDDEVVLLRAQMTAMNTKTKSSDKKDQKDADGESDDKTRKKSNKNMNNYRKIIVADNESINKYKTEYRGRVQDRNVNILPRPMFVLTYYERRSDVNTQVNFDKHVNELNEKKLLPYRLLITNTESSLTEKQVKLHFESIDKYSAAIVANPENTMNYYARALDFYLVQDFDNAIHDLNEAITRNPSFSLAYFTRALIDFKQLEYRMRDKKMEVELEVDKNTQVRTYDYARVRDDLNRAIELTPDFAFAYYNRANVHVVMKDFHAAIVDYNKALQLDPSMADAYYNRGLTKIFLGNNREGIQDLSKAGELGIFSAYNVIKRFTSVEK